MKIRMQALAAGPSGTWQPGQIVEVPEAVGRRLVAGGYAVDLSPDLTPRPSLKGRGPEQGEEVEETPKPLIEDATAPVPPEQAVVVRKKRH